MKFLWFAYFKQKRHWALIIKDFYFTNVDEKFDLIVVHANFK